MSNSHTFAGPRGLDHLMQLAAAQRFELACEHFYFLRHGQTERNARRIFQAPDEPLNATGQAQARRASTLLAAEPIVTVVCSDTRRTLETAATVAAPFGLTARPHAGLRERNFGSLIGTSSVAIDWDCAPAAGETLAEFVDRSAVALLEALAHPAPVLVVAHGGILYVLAGLLNVALDARALGNAHPLRFEHADGLWRVLPLAASRDAGLNLA